MTRFYLLRVNPDTGDVDGRELRESPELLAALDAAQLGDTLTVSNDGTSTDDLCDAVADVARSLVPEQDGDR